MILFFLATTFFLTIKSWFTTFSFLISLFSIFAIARNPKLYFKKRSRHFWMIFVIILLPFLSELLVQLCRGSVILSSLDGPSRWVLFAFVFAHLSRMNCDKAILAVVNACGLAIGFVCLSLSIFPSQYWGWRAGTYFVDPITLACFVTALLAMFLFGWERDHYGWQRNVTRIIVIALGVYIAAESSSRGSWLSLTFVLVSFVLFSLRKSFRLQLTSLAALSIFGGILCVAVMSQGQGDDRESRKTAVSRFNEAVEGIHLFMTDRSQEAMERVIRTSTGQRLILGQVDIELIKRSPFLGTPDNELPTFDDLSRSVTGLTDEIYFTRDVAGSHSEFFAILVRQGLVFGTLTLLCFYVVPFSFVFAHRSRAHIHELMPFFGLFLTILVSSLGIQVFNLKMTTSFYGLCLTLFYSQIIFRKEGGYLRKQ